MPGHNRGLDAVHGNQRDFKTHHLYMAGCRGLGLGLGIMMLLCPGSSRTLSASESNEEQLRLRHGVCRAAMIGLQRRA
eukprot:3229930-Rhodomonas_salina.2